MKKKGRIRSSHALGFFRYLYSGIVFKMLRISGENRWGFLEENDERCLGKKVKEPGENVGGFLLEKIEEFFLKGFPEE
jgi:hypothetical protein